MITVNHSVMEIIKIGKDVPITPSISRHVWVNNDLSFHCCITYSKLAVELD